LLLIAMMAAISATSAWAQISVSGVVRDANGDVLPGVNVLVKGTQQGTATNLEGKFTLGVQSPDDILVFSFLGYKTQEVAVAGRTTIDVTMEFDSKELDELVVVGYGTVRKSDLTGSVVKVTSDKIEATPTTSIDQLLQGKSAGLVVYNTSGEPGAAVTMRIRGAGSLFSSNDPMYVVDGFPVGSAGALKHINPQDIESIEVLKDASSVAIYGSRGANGVIMVTTKKGHEGKATLEVSYQQTYSTLAKDYDYVTDPLEYAMLDNEERMNGGVAQRYIGGIYEDGGYYPSLLEISSGAWKYSTNWQKVVYRTARTNNLTVSARGGNQKTIYSFSGNFLNQQGIQIESSYKKIIAAANVEREVYKNMKLGVNVNLSFGKNDPSSIGNGASRSPVFPVYNDNGEYYLVSSKDYGHPIANAREILSTGEGRDLYSLAHLDWNPIPWLKYRAQVGVKTGHSISDSYEPRVYTYNGDQKKGYGKISNYDDTKFLFENYLTVDKTFNDIHTVNAMIGSAYEEYTNRTSQLLGENFINDNIGNEHLNDAQVQTVYNSKYVTALASVFGRVNYSLMDKYLVTFTARYDGSSKFGANNKWAMFPSGAVSWKMHKENFMGSLEWLSQAKWRVSYGITGQQAISPYQTLARFGSMKYFDPVTNAFVTAFGPGYISEYYGEEYIKIFKGISNPNLKWESIGTFNVGLDLSFFKGRYNLTLEYYKRKTVDLLRDKRLPSSSGYDWITVNEGENLNKGIELVFDGIIVNHNGFKWDVGFNFARNRNELLSLGGLQPGSFEFLGGDIEKFRQAINCYMVGEPIGLFYGYKTDGIIQTEAEGLAAGLVGTAALPGEIKYVDLNKDGVIDNKDWTVIGDPNPDFTYGINMLFTYRGFELSFAGSGTHGNDVFNINKNYQATVKRQRWSIDNPTNEYPRLNSNRSWMVSDWFVEDGSFFKIQNISFGYNLSLSNQKIFRTAKVYASCQNVYTFSQYTGYDPESGGERGLNYGAYPKARVFTFGINMTF